MIDKKILDAFFFKTDGPFKGHLEYLHPGAQPWLNAKHCFVMNDENTILSGDDKAFHCEVFCLNINSCRYSLCGKFHVDFH